MDTLNKKPVKSIKKLLKLEISKVRCKCAYCGKPFDNRKHRVSLDHVVPKYSSGDTKLGNLLVVCTYCNNVIKGNDSLSVFTRNYPKVKFFILKYLSKVKHIVINGENYYESIKWVKDYIK